MEADSQIESLYRSLREIEQEIDQFIEENAFYLNFKNKAWAACPQGQRLLSLSERWVGIRVQIQMEKLKEKANGTGNQAEG